MEMGPRADDFNSMETPYRLSHGYQGSVSLAFCQNLLRTMLSALVTSNHAYKTPRYEENLVETMLRYSTHPPHYLSEVEVCAGSILGKNGAQSHRQREFSVGMKEQYERDVAYTVACITQGEDGAGTNQALERSIACLAVGCTRVRVRKKVGELVSFAWVAAAVCLKEVERLRGS